MAFCIVLGWIRGTGLARNHRRRDKELGQEKKAASRESRNFALFFLPWKGVLMVDFNRDDKNARLTLSTLASASDAGDAAWRECRRHKERTLRTG